MLYIYIMYFDYNTRCVRITSIEISNYIQFMCSKIELVDCVTYS